jgi:hypothetical protein
MVGGITVMRIVGAEVDSEGIKGGDGGRTSILVGSDADSLERGMVRLPLMMYGELPTPSDESDPGSGGAEGFMGVAVVAGVGLEGAEADTCPAVVISEMRVDASGWDAKVAEVLDLRFFLGHGSGSERRSESMDP